MRYDYVIVGAGLFGSTLAYELNKQGKKVLVIDKRNTIGGNVYTENVGNIVVHKYGAHIFHTSNKMVWDYINQFAEFNNFVNSPIANYYGELYNLPFNMNTFNKLWGVITPTSAKAKIEEQASEITEITNLEEQAISLVGRDIYEILVKGYTEKQWGKDCTELPPSIIKRLPVRFTYNNNYFNDRYQGIPIGGYTQIIEKMLEGIDVELSVDFLNDKAHYESICNKVIYTGKIDEYYDYCYGDLEYRSLTFLTTELEDMTNFQGVAVMNFTDRSTPFTRIIEHKHFDINEDNIDQSSIITQEYPAKYERGGEAYYTINDEKNTELYNKYRSIENDKVIFGGRLGDYKYYDMDKTIEKALELAKELGGK